MSISEPCWGGKSKQNLLKTDVEKQCEERNYQNGQGTAHERYWRLAELSVGPPEEKVGEEVNLSPEGLRID